MKNTLITIAVAALICGCATAPQPLPVEVKIPVPVTCIKPEQIPGKPDYESLKDNDSTPDGTVILHVARDFAKSVPYQEQLAALVVACK
jgi:hypothetical protein